MTFAGDFGDYVYSDRGPWFHLGGILGSPAFCDGPSAIPPFECREVPPQSRSPRAENDRLSRQVRAGLWLLLASCGWIVGGEEGAKHAIARGAPLRDRGPSGPHAPAVQGWINVLMPTDAPELFAAIDRICWRANLQRRPEIRVIVGQQAMNAYAFGGPNHAIITFTEGLLRGMTTKEAAAIFAHEIAHICNGDSSTMSWAAHLQRAINDISAAAGLVPGYAKSRTSLHWLLQHAPAIAELLMLALSRFREIEADAFALELIGDAKTLETALAKLEHHHRAISGIPADYVEDRLGRYLRSHPMTSDRIGHLRASPLYGAL